MYVEKAFPAAHDRNCGIPRRTVEWKSVRGGGPQTVRGTGPPAPADSGNDKYPYFFGSAQQLAVGMRTAMRAGAPKSDEL